MSDVPNSYKDPYWTQIASAAEAKAGIPEGLLQSIVTKGEKTNADQVSEAGAKTPFQITPQTRKLALDKYGVDAYLSPENAAEVAARLLKDSIERNKGDTNLAVAEYHGGTDRANWGPKTKAYVQRVTGEQAKTDQAPQSTFQRVMAAQKPNEQTSIAAIYDAYKSGRMAPEDAKAFEDDVRAGVVMLPKGAFLTGEKEPPRGAQAPEAIMLPQGITDAYVSGKMSPEDRAQLEQDIKDGLVKLPPSLVSQIPTEEPGWKPPTEQGIIAQPVEPSLGEKITGVGEAALSTITGMTGGTLGLLGGAAGGLAGAIVSGKYGTQDAANLVEQEAMKGAQTLTYAPRTEAGQDYARSVASGMEQLVPVMPMTAEMGLLGAGMKQAQPAISATSRAVTTPVISGANRAAEAVQATASKAGQAIGSIPGKVGEMVGIKTPEPTSGPLAAQELAKTAKKAAEGGIGSKAATQVLAEQAAPDAKTVAAADRLGIADYLQPDHVTTNQAYRELAQAVKSIPGSEARSAELEGLTQVAKRADELITELGGSHDLAGMSSGVKKGLQETVAQLEEKANVLYDQLRKGIPAKTEAPATSVLEFIAQRADELGGAKNLTPLEKNIVSKLSPSKKSNPTYTLLDDVRKDVGAAARNAGPFKDADSGLAKKLYSLIGKDQEAIANSAGLGDVFKAAKQAVSVRKGIEDDLISLFGKNLDSSIVGDLSGAVRALPSGDVSKFLNLIKAVPENMRQETVASGLASAFGKSAKQGNINFNSYAKWYEGLLKNKQAYTAVMSNLPRGARKQLSDLYRVSKSISLATKERITTGRIQAVAEELKGADGLIGSIYGLAKRAAIGSMAELVTTPLGMPGAGISAGIASALTKGKPSLLKSADALMSSPEFIASAKQAAKGNNKQAAQLLASSKAFDGFAQKAGLPKERPDREAWILQALEAGAINQNQSNKR